MNFIAAVRYADGSRARFAVNDVESHEAARQAVLDQVPDVRVVLVALA